ncbi:hypothetical protein [Sphingomonas sp. GV3]|uniref:hypothetical protein n=1 Tax=Sphingomonas sp. GV3 TaxID=3040671 RepID=UPI00280B1888|nr:hypothetical protein [Sphingomonas sp. GV3]
MRCSTAGGSGQQGRGRDAATDAASPVEAERPAQARDRIRPPVLPMTAAVLAALFPISADAEVLRVEGIFAATAREASLLPTLGVGAIGGPEGGRLADAIAQRLATLGRDGVRHAQIVPASLRPDGLLVGDAGATVSHDDYSETRERCTEKKDGKCVSRTRYRVACTRRTIAVRADLRVLRWNDRRVLFASPKTRDDSSSWCEDSGVETSVDGEIQAMVDSIAQEVRLDLAPHRESYKVRVLESRDGLPPEAAAVFKQAVRQTKHDPAAACRGFAQVDTMVPDHGPTMFNLALCAEAAGLYPEARDRYGRARLFAPKAGGEVTRGLARVGALAAGDEDVRHMAAL